MSTSTKLSVSGTNQPPTPDFYVVSIGKLICMGVATAGLYIIYWAYRHWAAYRDSTGASIAPLVRSLVPVLFIYPLLKKVDQGIKRSGQRYRWSASNLSLAMWLAFALCLLAASMAPEVTGSFMHNARLVIRLVCGYFLYLSVNIWLLCQMQRAINFYERDPQGMTNDRLPSDSGFWFGVSLFWGLFLIIMTFTVWLSAPGY